MSTPTSLWIVESSGDNRLPTIKEIDCTNNDYSYGGEAVNGRMIINAEIYPPYVLRRKLTGHIEWEILIYRGTLEMFIGRERVTREVLFDWLSDNYPADLEFILFHPELLEAKFNEQ